MKQKALTALIAALFVCSGPILAEAYAVRVGNTLVAILGATRGHSVAYDSKHKVYLVVSTMGLLRGRFVSTDGAPVGTAFTIQASLNYTHFPRVAFSPDADGGAGAFLVTWHESDQPSGTSVHARLVSYAKGVYGPDTPIGVGSFWEQGAAVAYATVAKEFLVVWRSLITNDIGAVRVNNSGQPFSTVTIPSTPDGERDPNVAYNPATNEFLLVYSGWNNNFAFVEARRIGAGAGGFVGPRIPLIQTAGTFITDVTYNPGTNQFLAVWYSTPSAVSLGRVVNADGSLPGNVLTLSTRWKAYDAISVAHNPKSNTFFMVSHSDTAEDGGVEIGSNGVPIDNGFLVTAAGGNGNFYPEIAANTDLPDWLVTTSNAFTSTMIQRLSGSAGVVTPPPPPPPPACTYAISPGSANVAGGSSSAGLTLTTGSGCAWTAASSAGWLTVATPAGTGPATVTFSYTANQTGAPRSATIAVGGQTFSVTQSRLSAAVHDVNGDGLSDMLWHNQATGQLVAWYVSGRNVYGMYYLPSAEPDTNWKVVGTGDIDGDGYADLVWQHANGSVRAWRLRGLEVLGSNALSIPQVADTNWKIRAVGDVDGDGRADIIWQHDGSGALVVWAMSGYTVSSFHYLSITPVSDLTWKIAGAGDINGDGRADIIWQNQASGHLVAWLMNGNTVMGWSFLSNPRVSDLTWQLRGVGDFNGDGRADLVWQNTATGDLVSWYLNGFNVLSFGYLSQSRIADLTWKVVGPG